MDIMRVALIAAVVLPQHPASAAILPAIAGSQGLLRISASALIMSFPVHVERSPLRRPTIPCLRQQKGMSHQSKCWAPGVDKAEGALSPEPRDRLP